MDHRNPEKQRLIVPHAIYNTYKNATKQIQYQREQAQHTISYLERQAKKSAKELETKQKCLINCYKLKQNRFQVQLQKQKLKKKRQEELQRQRKANTLSRQSSASQKALNKRHLLSMNNRSFSQIKKDRCQSERKKKQMKQLESQLLKNRNQIKVQSNISNTQHAKAKYYLHKRHQSSEVKKDLIYLQMRVKNREMETIGTLSSRQKELIQIVQRNKKRKSTYESILHHFQSIPFDEIYPKIHKKTVTNRSTSRHSSMRSESFLI